jgi:aryl-alcohol dehydrogenase-like predicted oxidoreductase
MQYRPLGNTTINVSAVALGCWPIAGLTSPGVTDENSIATIRACFELGINHLDTAHMYGHNGESERLIARALGNRRHEMVIATKGGLYWPLMKGLLAGKIKRSDVFAATDSRRKYAMFQGDQWQKNHDLVDRLRQIAAAAGRTVAQLVINWTIHQPGMTAAICGAKRPDQIRETAGAVDWELTPQQRALIDEALAERGTPATQMPV